MVTCEFAADKTMGSGKLPGLSLEAPGQVSTANSHLRAAQIAMSIGDLSAIPPVVIKALQTLKDPRVSSQDLAKLISMDHSITARLIAMANAARMERSTTLATVGDAIMCLGHKNTQAMLCAAAAHTVLCRPVTLYGMKRNVLWRHSVGCAVSSRVIAKEHNLWDPGEAYVAGLLHDIGLPALERFVRRKSKIIDLIRTADYPPFMAEQMVLGFDHAYLGSLICQFWQLAGDLVTAVSSHHDPLGRERLDVLPAIVYLADNIAAMPEIWISDRPASLKADPSVIEWLGLEPDDINRLFPEVRAQLKQLGIIEVARQE